MTSSSSIRPATPFHACDRMPTRRRRSAVAKSFDVDAPSRMARLVAPSRAVSISAQAPSKETRAIPSALSGGWRRAELFEGGGQLRRDSQRIAVLDLAALEHVDDLAIA